MFVHLSCLSSPADAAAKDGNIAAVERAHFVALLLQGLRIAIPAAFLIAIPASAVQDALGLMPDWLNGMAVGGAMVVAVGYAMVINMMANRSIIFFAICFALAAISQLTFDVLVSSVLPLPSSTLTLQNKVENGGGGAATSNDPIGDILEDY